MKTQRVELPGGIDKYLKQCEREKNKISLLICT